MSYRDTALEHRELKCKECGATRLVYISKKMEDSSVSRYCSVCGVITDWKYTPA